MLAANAIAHFENYGFRATRSKYDLAMKEGRRNLLSFEQQKGMKLFFGKAQCSRCHSGPLFSDQKFYSIALPPIGWGKRDGRYMLDDFGLTRETKSAKHMYKFRTPSLRNITRTSPYGHNGAYKNLTDMILHHTNPRKYIMAYQAKPAKVVLPYRGDLAKFDFALLRFRNIIKNIGASSDIEIISISRGEVLLIAKFLASLEEVDFDRYLKLVPKAVPSGLPVDD